MTIFNILFAFALGQDDPTEIAKIDLPKMAKCSVCAANGAGHEDEEAVGGVKYKGKAYYFCNKSEIATFKKNPNLYVPLELPMALPSFDLTDTNGKIWDKDAFAGRLVLIDYWATWCKPCLELKPKLDKILVKYRPEGFEMLSVSIDEKQSTLDKFLSKGKWDNPVAWDSKQTWTGLRVVTIPALFLVKDGQVVSVFRGVTDPKIVESAIKKYLP